MGMGVAGIIVDSLIVSQWIIPIHSLLSTSKSIYPHNTYIYIFENI